MDRTAIIEVLERQAAAWSRDDLAGYLDTYARSEQLTFAWDGKRVRGFQALYDGYTKKYEGVTKLGKLSFDIEHVDFLGPDHAVTVGLWHLRESDHPGDGVFTFILARRPEGWRILVDHNSSTAAD
ncbi:MAG TPA: SgcJ/EcaC family oxidoreductase [Kofleriaceae bacterium]|jgi:uncharacterized protein (TIGR02246 family)|nr:SgcJ/EcaC family oxidoreductase [Kofleriaceae bacterium]